MTSIQTSHRSLNLLRHWIEMPDLARAIQELPAQNFSALIRDIGVEDAGELVSLATREQLVAAFDEDLFSNHAPGQRESFDRLRFATWLEVLLESGDKATADRFVEFSEDFVLAALSSLVLVLEESDLREALQEDSDSSELADKVLQSALSEEIDGFVLIALEPEAWDSMLALILALDQYHRSFLSRILSRSAALATSILDDLGEFTERLSDLESLAEDVEAEREGRRSAQGYVEPRAARNFLSLARKSHGPARTLEEDPITKLYFRDLGRSKARSSSTVSEERLRLKGAASTLEPRLRASALRSSSHAELSLEISEPIDPRDGLGAALRSLAQEEPLVYERRVEELAYLANVLVSGAVHPETETCFEAKDALRAACATVAHGAFLEHEGRPLSLEDWTSILRETRMDRLFRVASAQLPEPGFLLQPG